MFGGDKLLRGCKVQGAQFKKGGIADIDQVYQLIMTIEKIMVGIHS